MGTMDGRVGPIQWRLLCAIDDESPFPNVLALAIERAGLGLGNDSVRPALAGLIDRGFIEHCAGEEPHRLAHGCLVMLTPSGLTARSRDGAGLYQDAVRRATQRAAATATH